MSGVEKTNNRAVKILSSGVKVILISGAFLLAIFLFAYIALQYGVNIENLASSIRANWFIWLCIRLAIYGIGAFLLFNIYQRTKGNRLSEYKKMTKAAIICVVVVELINLSQLLEG